MEKEINFPDNFPSFETNRLALSAFSSDDVENFYLLRSNKDFMKYLGLNPMTKRSEARERVHEIIQAFKTQEGITWKISLKGTNELIGYIGYWRINYRHFRGEMGFGLNEAHQNKGYMSEIMPEVLAYAFKQLNLNSVMADVDPDNSHSIKLLEKSGFMKDGHFRENNYFNGTFLDSTYYSILSRDFNNG